MDIIGRNDFNSPTFTISDYFPFFSLSNDTLVLLIFDFEANKMFIYSSPISTMTNHVTLSNETDLSVYDSYFTDVVCSNDRKNHNEFTCQLISPTRVFSINII